MKSRYIQSNQFSKPQRRGNLLWQSKYLAILLAQPALPNRHMGLRRYLLQDLGQPPYMNPSVVGELGVEARAKDVLLAHGDDVALIGCTGQLSLRSRLCRSRDSAHDLHRAALLGRVARIEPDLLDDGCSDKDTSERGGGIAMLSRVQRVQERKIQVRYEAVRLPAVAVSLDFDVQPSDEVLAALLGGAGRLG